MRAIVYERNGPAAEVLVAADIPAPKPQAGEVLVRLKASGINPIDTKWRRGLKAIEPGTRVVPHFDGAGTIEAVGAGVPATRVGERVWIYETAWQRPQGTACEYATVPAGCAVALPEGVDFAAGATLGIPALTAHRCVFADGPVQGQTVLVTGGAGAVGAFAVRFAALGGARVIATVSSEAKAEVARRHGAADIVDYKRENVAERLKALTGGAGVARIVEVALGANFAVSAEAIAANGTIAAYASDTDPTPQLPFRVLLYKNVTLRHVLVFGMPAAAKQAATTDITRWLADGSLKPHVGLRLPLAKAAEGHAAVEAGSLGNVVLEI